MRLLRYNVTDGIHAFDTADYTKIVEKGWKILSIYLVDIDPRPEKVKEATRRHAQKVKEKLAART